MHVLILYSLITDQNSIFKHKSQYIVLIITNTIPISWLNDLYVQCKIAIIHSAYFRPPQKMLP